MRLFLSCILSFGFSLSCLAQNFKISRGEELKLHAASNDLEILDYDNSGFYLLAGRVKSNGLSIKEPYNKAYTLYKFDRNHSLLFSKDYVKDLKGFDVNSAPTLKDKLFIFATDYDKKGKSFTIYGAGVNKNSGELEPALEPIESHIVEKEDDTRYVNISKTEDGNSIQLITRIFGTSQRSITVTIIDSMLHKIKSATINFPLDGPTRDAVDHVLYTKGKIIVWARRSERIKVKKSFEFKLMNYLLMVYDMSGKKLSESKVECDDKYVSNEKFVRLPDGRIILTGFYCKDTDYKDVTGFFIYNVNAETGELEKRSFKEISTASFSSPNNEKAIRFPDKFVIRSIDVNPVDGGIVITAEYFDYTRRLYSNNKVDWQFMSQYILVVRIHKDGEIGWVNLIPKFQKELFEVALISSAFGSGMANGGGMPYYSSYTQLIKDNKLIIFLNDDNDITSNPKYGDKLREIINFKNTNLYGVSVDLSSGSMTRKIIASNSSDNILTPRHALVRGNEIFMPTWREHMIGKSEFSMAQITVE